MDLAIFHIFRFPRAQLFFWNLLICAAGLECKTEPKETKSNPTIVRKRKWHVGKVLYDHCFHSTTAFYVQATYYLELEVYSMKSRLALGGGDDDEKTGVQFMT